MPTVRILIADDHPVVRLGVRTILENQSGWEICAETGDGRQAVSLAKSLKPDISIVDFYMPRLNGLEVTHQILRVRPQHRVLILTVLNSEEIAKEVLLAGARGYLLKADAGTELVAAVNALLHGGSYFTSQVADMVLGGFLTPEPNGPQSHLILTAREREVVQLFAEGWGTKEVAATLNMSVKTAETHRNNIMRKLNVHNIAGLVLYAASRNIVQTGVWGREKAAAA